MKGSIKLYSELSQAQRADVRKRMKPPYVGYYYKVAANGKVQYRNKKYQS